MTWDSPQTTSRPVVWHYTTGPGLQGILENNAIWASAASQLNDSSELQVGASRLAAYLDGSGLDDDQKGWAIKSACWGGNGEPDQRRGRYVLSASLDKDSLSLWRGYGVEDQAYSISIRTDVALRPIPQIRGTTHPCPPPDYEDLFEYDEDPDAGRFLTFSPEWVQEEVHQWVELDYEGQADEHLLRECAQAMIKVATQDEVGRGSSPRSLVPYAVGESLLWIKNREFRDEREVRTLVTAAPPWKFVKHRHGRFGFVPYVELGVFDGPSEPPASLDRLPIEEVVVGPSPHASAAADSLKLMLEMSGYHGVNVSLSGIPYRS